MGGSGLGCLLLERLSVDYGKKSKISFTVWSCPQISSACVEPYNTVLCVHSLLEHTDVTNQSTTKPSTISAAGTWTSSGRRTRTLPPSGAGDLVPDGVAPLRRCPQRRHHRVPDESRAVPAHPLYADVLRPDHLGGEGFHEQLSVAEITNSVFEPAAMMVKCDPRHGKYMACCMMYRGDVVPKDVNAS